METLFKGCSKTLYPRIRGEDVRPATMVRVPGALSPHTRGRRDEASTLLFQHRFIPAYAGKTFTVNVSGSCPTLYPRIRGEDNSCHSRQRAYAALSPHTRGRHQSSFSQMAQLRFIPAYAGKTCLSWRQSTNQPLYPRIRGEDCLVV